MPPLVQVINLVLSSLTVLAQIASIVLIVALLAKHKGITSLAARYALLGSFIVALIATGGSLFYSEIAGYEPCKLCWFQRIFMYPQVILLGLALAKKISDALIVAGTLSAIGGIIAGYHYLLQLGVIKGSCGVVGYSVACSQRFVMNFGYITIPLMAFSAFLLIFLIAVAFYRTSGHESSSQKNNP